MNLKILKKSSFFHLLHSENLDCEAVLLRFLELNLPDDKFLGENVTDLPIND